MAQSVGSKCVFITAWMSSANILALTAGGANTEVAGLRIFYEAFTYLKMGPATAKGADENSE